METNSEKEALAKVLKEISIDPKNDFSKNAFLEVLKLLPAVPNVPGAEVYFELGKKTVPLVAEIILIKDGQTYLTYRDDKFWKGRHFPGGARVPNMPLIDNCDSIAKRELGEGIDITKVTEIGFVDHPNSPRFHDASVLVLCEFEGDPTGGEWFSERPKDLLDYHDKYWPIVEKFF